MPAPLLIENATILTMDGDRRLIDRGFVLIEDGRIAVLCEGEAPDGMAVERIDASGMVAMPGMIDTHAHAGHMLTKGLGADSGAWMDITGRIYAEATDPEFWAAEAQLSALERIRCGTTTAVLLLGGGADIMRCEAPEAAEAHLGAIADMGVREILAIGPNRPDTVHRYRVYAGDGSVREADVSPFGQLDVCADLIDRWAGRSECVSLALSLPVFSAVDLQDGVIRALALKARDLAREKGVLLVQDGHKDGSIAANDAMLRLFDGPSLLAHCIDLTDADIVALKRTGAKVAHNPSALMSVYGRCPAPELMAEGITVALGTDAAAPDRGFDMFRNLFQTHRYHARHFRDDTLLPPMQLLDLATRAGAEALGLANEIGSLEPGKRADLILVNMRRPHLWPPANPAQRIAFFANGADVDTTIVNGRVLMRGRVPAACDENAILERARRAYDTMLQRAGLA